MRHLVVEHAGKSELGRPIEASAVGYSPAESWTCLPAAVRHSYTTRFSTQTCSHHGVTLNRKTVRRDTARCLSPLLWDAKP